MKKKYEKPIMIELEQMNQVLPQCTMAKKPKRSCKSLPSGTTYKKTNKA